MGRYSGSAKTDREPFTQARLLRLIICVLGTGILFTVLFGEWVWHLQLVLGAVIGVSISILTEVLILIWQDERHHQETDQPNSAAVTRRREGNRSD